MERSRYEERHPVPALMLTTSGLTTLVGIVSLLEPLPVVRVAGLFALAVSAWLGSGAAARRRRIRVFVESDERGVRWGGDGLPEESVRYDALVEIVRAPRRVVVRCDDGSERVLDEEVLGARAFARTVALLEVGRGNGGTPG